MSDASGGHSEDWAFGFNAEPTPPAGTTGITSEWRPGSHLPPPGQRSYGGGASGGSAGPQPPRGNGRSEVRRLLAALLVVVAGGLGYLFGHGTVGSSQTYGAGAIPGSGSALPGSGTTPTAPGNSGATPGYTAPGNNGSTPRYGYGNGYGNGNGLGAGTGAPSSASGAPSNASAIAAKVSPALVDVNSTFSYESAEGAGTGIVMRSDGIVLTNNHVVEGATTISVTDIGNHRTYAATVLGYDLHHDIAVIKLTGASGLTTAKLGDSSTLRVGQGVVAIGNAGGVGGTPTVAGGSVTGLGKSITASDSLSNSSEKLTGLVETNADVQPGDSGGSLVDTKGAVVGVDSAASEGFAFNSSGGQGYAIPINQALSIAHSILKNKGTADIHVGPTAFLGVEIQSASTAATQGQSQNPFGGGFGSGGYAGANACEQEGATPPVSSGAWVCSLVQNEPATAAGVSAGSVITTLDHRSVTSTGDVSTILIPLHPGDHTEIGWVDPNGASHTSTITLGTGPPA